MILITGAAQNLGKEIAFALAKKGYDVVIHYNRSEKEAYEVLRRCLSFGVAADCIQGDLSHPSAFDEFIRRYKTRFANTTGLINNVGPYLEKSVSNTMAAEMNSLFYTNCEMPCALINHLLLTLQTVVNIGLTGLHAFRANTMCPVYYAAKGALWALTKSLAKEHYPKIRLNMVSPGFLENYMGEQPPTCTFQEVADCVALLFSNPAITGQNIEIAGSFGL